MEIKPESTQALIPLQDSTQRNTTTSANPPAPSSMGKDLNSMRENGEGEMCWCWGMVLCTLYSDADYCAESSG